MVLWCCAAVVLWRLGACRKREERDGLLGDDEREYGTPGVSVGVRPRAEAGHHVYRPDLDE
mgnify:CR=1 FL=1